MTGPTLDTGTLTRLGQIASWDGLLVTGARCTLADVLDRLSTWRARLDGLGRALGEAECWSGPAADAAATTVAELSRTAAAVQSALGRSQEGWDALSASAGPAQALAERALAVAALADGGPAGWPLPSAAPLAAEALAEAAAAGAAARRADEEASGLTVRAPAARQPTVPDLLAGLGPVTTPVVPAGRPPAEVATWWAGLSAAEHGALLEQDPTVIGSLDGTPAWARDTANRLVLGRMLEDPSLPDDVASGARLLDARIQAEEAAGRTVQLHLLDLASDRVVLSFGDLDTADAVALLVPGVLTTPDDDLPALATDAAAVAAASRAGTPGLTVATVAWVGYRTPQTVRTITGRTASHDGGRLLDAALDGLTAARAAAGTPAPRTTVLAHSYGTVVVDVAADQPGRLAADAVVLLGSPGMAEDAASLEVPEVYDAGTAGDPISWLAPFGMPPGADAYGSTGLPTDTWAGHSDYYDADRPTLAAIGRVVAGAERA